METAVEYSGENYDLNSTKIWHFSNLHRILKMYNMLLSLSTINDVFASA